MRSPQAHISWFALFLTGSVREWVTWIKWGEKQSRTMQTWEGQAGGQDGCFFLLGGLWSPFCSRVLEELAWSSRPASCPASLGSAAVCFCPRELSLDLVSCVSAWVLALITTAKLYTVYQHLGEVVLWLPYGSLLLFIVLGFVFPNKSHSCDFFLCLFYFIFETIWHRLGGMKQIQNKTNTESRFEIFFSTEMWCYWLSVTPKFDPLVHALIEFNLICLFVVFKLGSNYLQPKLMSSNGVRDTFLAVARFLIPRPFYSKGSSRFVTFCKTKSSQSVKMIF